jgi:serine/threonine protein kinase
MNRSDSAAHEHPTHESLQAFGNGRLVGDASISVQTHLDSCEVCRRMVSQLTLPPVSLTQAETRLRMPDSKTPGTATPMSQEGIALELANHPDYRILRELGRGGMGVVYLAHNSLMGRDEVLKVAQRSLLDEPGAGARFLQEIRSAAQLVHPNVVRA